MNYKENFYWMNEGKIVIEEDRITMTAPALTDFFCGGETISEEGILPESLCNAPYYYTEIEGDFVLKVKVSHEFKETYDSASVMVMQDMKNWAKCCLSLQISEPMQRLVLSQRTENPTMQMDVILKDKITCG